MDGLVIWDLQGLKILRIDYGQVVDPVAMLHEIMKEHSSSESDIAYSFVDFAYRKFPQGFIDTYKVLAARISENKKALVCAYIGLHPDHYEAAKEVAKELHLEKVYVEFFESEAAAMEWLLSFRDEGSNCE